MSSPLSVVPKKSAVKTRSVAGRQGRALMIKSEDPNSAGMSYRILKKYMYVCVLVVLNASLSTRLRSIHFSSFVI